MPASSLRIGVLVESKRKIWRKRELMDGHSAISCSIVQPPDFFLAEVGMFAVKQLEVFSKLTSCYF